MTSSSPTAAVSSFAQLDPRALASGQQRHQRHVAQAPVARAVWATVPGERGTQSDNVASQRTCDAERRQRMRHQAHSKLSGQQSAPATPLSAKPLPPLPSRARAASLAQAPTRTAPLRSRWSDSSASHESDETDESADEAPSQVSSPLMRGRTLPAIACAPPRGSSLVDQFARRFSFVSDNGATPTELRTPQAWSSPASSVSPSMPRSPADGMVALSGAKHARG